MVSGITLSPITQVDLPGGDADSKRRPTRKPFTTRRASVRMDPEAASRQGRAVTLAFAVFGDSASAMAFLNGLDAALGERPIDLAVASADGLARVAEAISARANHGQAG